jgi:glutamyl-tRNA reductase
VPGSVFLAARVAHQRETALDTRERLLASAAPAYARVVLATCHRVEIYEVADEPPADAEGRLLVDEAAAQHLFRVASGLDSAIAGEPQILRQLRAAYAAPTHGLHPRLRRTFERAMHVGRAIRRATALGSVRRSVGSLAVDHVMRALAQPERATVLVIGAGEMGKLAVRALARRVGEVIVANRDADRAAAVAAQNGAAWCALDAVPLALGRADAVISAADTRGGVLGRPVLEPRLAVRGLVLVDIAVPRSVAADARNLPGLAYASVDDLAVETTSVPATEIALASEWCDREARQLVREWRAREATETIRELRAEADAFRRAQLARAMRRLRHLGERDRGIVEALSVGVMNSLLHAPTVALREEPSRREVAQDLFRPRPRRPS